jgi:hypothetical protein
MGYTITVGKVGAKEIDFVCEKRGERLYVQVAYLIPDKKAREREFGNLLLIPDNYPKIVTSMDKLISGNERGIQHMHISEFLKAPL